MAAREWSVAQKVGFGIGLIAGYCATFVAFVAIFG